MTLEHFVLEAVLVNHDFEVDIDVLAALLVYDFSLLLFFLHGLHVQAALLPLLLQLLDFVQRVSWLGGWRRLVARLHGTSSMYYYLNSPAASNLSWEL